MRENPPLVTHPVYAGRVAAGLLLTLTLPGVVLLLLAVAVVEQLAAVRGRRGPVTRRHRHALSAGGLDVFSAALAPGRAVDLEEQQARHMIADDIGDGAPPRGGIDVERGIARL